jgi:molybdate transport system substrate-binding protein
LLALVAVLALAGCGGNGDRLTVYAAASLTDVFRQLDEHARYNFAGSDDLATQIREGAEADVYAAASPRYPEELFAEHLVDKPRVFATNRLVLIVPSSNPARVRSVGDLARGGVKLVIGAEGVPVGDYTRKVLENLGETDVLRSVVSEEEDVRSVLGKVAQGEADAGFVYVTDVRAAADEVRAIGLPAAAQAEVKYEVAVIAAAKHAEDAQAFVERLFGAKGQRVLRNAGFGSP